MSVGTKPQQWDIEKWAMRVKGCGAVGVLQYPLVAARGVVRSAVGRDRMNVLRRHRSFGEHGFAGHSIITVGMIVRDEALIAPVPGNARPRETGSKFIGREQRIQHLRRRAARERN